MSLPSTIRDVGRGVVGLTRRPKTTPGGLGMCDEFAGSRKGTLVAQAASPLGIRVLAEFDKENGVIWANEALLQAMARARSTGTKLSEANVATLTHEFAHVLDYEDIFEKFKDRGRITAELAEIASALRTRLAEKVNNTTEVQFMQHYLAKERSAEEYAKKITAELRGYHGSLRAFWVSQALDTWAHNTKTTYEEDARGTYRRIKRQLKELGNSPSKVAAEAEKKKKYRQKLLPVYTIVDIFPGREESLTLHNLLEMISEYHVVIVVSVPIESR